MGMRSYRIMEALSAVDEELLARCEQDNGCGHKRNGFVRGTFAVPKRIWQYAGVWAAVWCFVLIGAAGWGGYQLMRGAGSDGYAAGRDMNGQAQQEMCDVEIEEVGNGENAPEAPESCPEEGQMSDGGISGDMGGNGGMDGADRYKDARDGIVGEEGIEGGKSGIGSGTDGIRDGDPPAVERYENAEAEIKADMGDQSNEQQKERLLTWEEAWELEGMGGYVPRQLPEGYVFQRAAYYPDSGRSLTLHWSRGMDDIVLGIGEGGETVFMEYHETFDFPVFAFEDFDLEIVRSQMVFHKDAGDTDTPRGCFGVLYPDGVLVSFNGCGTAEEIWEMFCSMGESAQ